MGHSRCGGIASLLSSANAAELGAFVGRWVNIAVAARDKVLGKISDAALEDQARACVKKAILISLDNLKTLPWISEPVVAGPLQLHGWYERIDTGQLETYDPRSGTFQIRVAPYGENLGT